FWRPNPAALNTKNTFPSQKHALTTRKAWSSPCVVRAPCDCCVRFVIRQLAAKFAPTDAGSIGHVAEQLAEILMATSSEINFRMCAINSVLYLIGCMAR
ncbi:MAG: hypothetical protein KDA59_15530, partial [Planctomycetales bacterium]|nr:hypothetical protein [Planctomycetales bacterium]